MNTAVLAPCETVAAPRSEPTAAGNGEWGGTGRQRSEHVSARSLKSVIDGLWADLLAGRLAACPLCGGMMDAASLPTGDGLDQGWCGDCGSILS